jgi:hypothetical protein
MTLAESSRGIGHNSGRPDNGNGLTRKQIAAIRKANVLAAGIVRDCPEDLLRMFRDLEHPMSHLAIAAEIIPAVAKTNPGMARTAIAVALNTLLDPKEHEELSERRSVLFIERTIQSIDPETYRANQAKAARAKNAQVPDHLKGHSLVEGRGLIRWTEAEIRLVKILAASREFQHQTGNRHRIGTPDSANITEFINRVFHKGESVRTIDSVREFLRKPKTVIN